MMTALNEAYTMHCSAHRLALHGLMVEVLHLVCTEQAIVSRLLVGTESFHGQCHLKDTGSSLHH